MTEPAERAESADDEPEEEEAASPAAPRPAPATPVAEPLRFSPTTLIAVAMLVGAGAFAAGRSSMPSVSEPPAQAQDSRSQPPDSRPNGPNGLTGPAGMGGGPGMGGMGSGGEPLPPGHPPTGDLPPGHAGGMGGMGAGAPGAGDVAASALSWKAPPRWQQVPNPSTMRLATYRVPHAPGDSEDPELTITQAGGTVEANAQRWIGQFGADGAKTAKRSTRTVHGLEIAIVEVEGKFANGMGKEAREEDQWAMLGAIVQTPGMPHFLKLTGPAKSVKAARAEFDALVASLSPK